MSSWHPRRGGSVKMHVTSLHLFFPLGALVREKLFLDDFFFSQRPGSGRIHPKGSWREGK
jgi:hypothetical protein